MAKILIDKDVEIDIIYPSCAETGEPDCIDLIGDPTPDDGRLTTSDIEALVPDINLSHLVHGRVDPAGIVNDLQIRALAHRGSRFGDSYGFVDSHDINLTSREVTVRATRGESKFYAMILVNSEDERNAFVKYLTENDVPEWTVNVLEEVVDIENGDDAFLKLKDDQLKRLLTALGKSSDGALAAGSLFDRLSITDRPRAKKLYQEIAQDRPAIAARIMLQARSYSNPNVFASNNWAYNNYFRFSTPATMYEEGTGIDIDRAYRDPREAAGVQDEILQLLIDYRERLSLLNPKQRPVAQRQLRENLEHLRESEPIDQVLVGFNTNSGDIENIEVHFRHAHQRGTVIKREKRESGKPQPLGESIPTCHSTKQAVPIREGLSGKHEEEESLINNTSRIGENYFNEWQKDLLTPKE